MAETEKLGDWTDAELLACVIAYREMQMGEEGGQKINKTEKRNSVLQDALSSRSSGAYEFRMANISAVLERLGLPILIGYQPRRNVGTRVTSRLLPMINLVWQRQDVPELPTANAENLQTRVMSARKKIKVDPASPPPSSPSSGTKTENITTRFIRDPNVIAWVLVKAGGICEACGTPAPFVREDGEPYLEVHHVRPLAEGGPDGADNAVAACPTCHRRFHHGADKDSYRKATVRRVGRLVNYPKISLTS
ncbi:HNH endonuclease signature motif containing protein [Phyllobacterium sp. UNC302MFCol5.2]|uniref:HNH endonuclease n=1 Tax=Phyllobacterium sp. UNC302MFCol5.2 TaxID=1449065 RepID=UPI0009DE230C|nr:HNH endonuclease signature motif containing protein [Phyllobacterium sp. UNC302MFCol5.2]